MKKQSISKNLLFQFLYQILILVVPMILSPYLTRTLQETALGVYSYTNSIAYYFVMLSMLGISKHGQRVISQNTEDEIQLRKTFWSLFFAHIVVSAFFSVLYLLFVLSFEKDHTIIYLIQGFYVLSALFDITWLFYGLENFKSVVIKNTVVKIAECALIFIFVKAPEDLWKYTLIASCGLLLGQIVMLPQAIRLIKPIKFSVDDVKQHMKPLLLFSVSVIASSLYTVFDKTLLGLMTTKENVAFYEYSNNVVRVPRTVIGVIGTVMFPRACKLALKGDFERQKRYIKYSFDVTAFIGIGTIFGLFAVADLFAVIYFGQSFSICGTIMKTLSPVAYIIGIGEVVRTQYMIPNHMDKQYNLCIILNAVVNLIFSFLLIPVMGVYGAVAGTLAAEIFGVVYQMILCRKFIHVSTLLKSTAPFIVSGLLMLGIVRLCAVYIDGTAIALLIQIGIGFIAYCIFGLIYIFLFRKDIASAIHLKRSNLNLKK